jgi:hypothetical protein
MNCHDFDQIWNELLDAETASVDRRATAIKTRAGPRSPADRELAAREHAVGCSTCRLAQVKYETLRQALRAWNLESRPSSAPSTDLVERFLAAVSPSVDSHSRAIDRTDRASRSWRIGLPLGLAVAVAAAVLALVISPIRWDLKRHDGGGARQGVMNQPGKLAGRSLSPSLSSRRAGLHGLSDSLADATAATWDLARSTSEPAARLGRQVIGAASQAQDLSGAGTPAADPTEPFGSGLVSLPSVLRGDSESPPGSTLLHDVGDRLSASIRPLSSTARQAFGFLRTPSLEKNEHRISQPASKGA